MVKNLIIHAWNGFSSVKLMHAFNSYSVADISPTPSPPSTIISYCLHINSKSFFKDIFIVVKSKLYKLVYLCIQQLRTYHPPHPQLHIACILNWIYFQNFHICCVRIKFIFDSIYLGNLFNCITIFIDKYTLNDYKIKLLSKYIFSSY